MEHLLTRLELRVLGSLIEKEITTPDQYPLSLNALKTACNQKSNREPVMELDDLELQQTLDELKKRHLVREETGRVCKYKHRFCNTEFSELKLSSAQLAVLCVLFLRGPQTPGELRQRCARLHPFDAVEAVERTLNSMIEAADPLALKLPREPGKRECRYAHTFGEEQRASDFDIASDGLESELAVQQKLDYERRIQELETDVARLHGEFDRLKSKLENLLQ